MYSGKEVLRGSDCSIFPRRAVVDYSAFHCMSNFVIPHQTVINGCLEVFPKFNFKIICWGKNLHFFGVMWANYSPDPFLFGCNDA